MSKIPKPLIPLFVLFLMLASIKSLIAAPTVQDSITGLYTAYYNRAPDKAGYDYWNQQASLNGNTSALKAISEGFSKHPQFLQDYSSSDTSTQFVTKIYNNILNRAPDAGGLAYWVNKLDGGMSKSEFIMTYVNDVLGYSGTDADGITSKQMFSHKVTLGQCFIDALGEASNGEPNSEAYTRSIEVLSEVTENTSTLSVATNKIKGYLPTNTILPNSCPKLEQVTGFTTVQFKTNMGDFEVKLYNEETPKSVANFLRYVNAQAYDNSIIHRSIDNFIVQGGGYHFMGEVPLTEIPTNTAVINEPEKSNLRGTLAYAKLSGQPNSATSGWFINLTDNSANLDRQNEGFTVFGEVMGGGMTVIDTIATLKTFNGGGAFGDLPLQNFTAGDTPNETNFVIITSVRVMP